MDGPPKSRLFALDRDAETSPKRLAVLIGLGLALVVIALWMFGDDDEAVSAPFASPSQPVLSTPTDAPGPPAAPAALSASVSQLTLHGVMGLGASGAAIIAVGGGDQHLVRVGRDIVPGLTLIAIAADHVIVAERGQNVRLGFPEAGGAGLVSPVASTPSATARRRGASDAVDYRLGLAPERSNGRTEGYRIRPDAVPATLEQAGLRAGDVVVRVGGTNLESPDDVERIPRELRGSDAVTIEYFRDGRRRETNFRPR